MLAPMGDTIKLIWWAVIGLFRSRVLLEAEILTLRHQLNVLRRKSPKRLAFSTFDRLVFASLYRIAPRILNALVIVQPETVIRWYRAGFRLFWRSRRQTQAEEAAISGLEDVPLQPRRWDRPWQNGHTERLIGSSRRECHYDNGRGHTSLNKDARLQAVGRILPTWRLSSS
jgi:hypothetical protein